jgi:hypothetical protein
VLSLLASKGSRKSDDQAQQERFAHGPDATFADQREAYEIIDAALAIEDD